jgi:8-oxo-dGTP diphosphatase
MSLFGILGRLTRQHASRLVVSASIFDGDRVLMVKEGRAHKRGEWNLPSGRVDRGEGVIEAAVREAREETALDIAIVALAGIYIYPTRSGEDVVRFNFIAEATGGTPAADGSEIIEVRWMTLDEIDALPDSRLRATATLRNIVSDLRTGRRFPLDLVRDRRE